MGLFAFALSVSIAASAYTSTLPDIVQRACRLQKSKLSFTDDKHDRELALAWRSLHLEIEALFENSTATDSSDLRAELDKCASRALEDMFREIKSTSLTFGRRPMNDVVFWISRVINANAASLSDSQSRGEISAKAIVQKYFRKAYSYSVRGTTYESVLKKIRRDVTNAGLNTGDLEKIILEVQTEIEDHLDLHGVRVKEGDLLLLFDDHALGDLAYPMVGIQNLMGHGAMVVSGRWGPVKTYYVAEVLDKITVTDLADFPQSVVLRPKGFSLEGKTAGLMEMIKSRPFRFDSKFRDDLLDEEGKAYSLYCAEFIHYAYKNGFDPRAPESPSPFDFVEYRVEGREAALKANAEKMGLPAEQRLFLPEQLFFNPQTEVAGVLRKNRFRGIHPGRMRLISELESEFYHQLKERFSNRHLRDLTGAEKKTVDVLLWLSNLARIYDTSKVEFPEAGGQYYFFKLILTVQRLRLLTGLRMGAVTSCEEELVWSKFANQIIPRLDDLFHEAPR
jgi:hypothetical protein